MAIVRGMRALNGVEAGLINSAALEALLADGGRKAELSALFGMRGQARRMADAALTSTTLGGSALASGALFANRTAAAEFATNPVGSAVMKASRTAMRAATLNDPGMRQFCDKFPWLSRATNVASFITDVVYGNNVWVAVGDGGVVSTSADGVTWVARSPVAAIGAGGLLGAAFGNGVFLAATTAAIFTSTDGIAWTSRAVPAGMSSITGVKFVNGQFFLLGGNGSPFGVLSKATDPTAAWPASTVLNGTANALMYDLAYGNGVYVAFGRGSSSTFFHTSPDAVTWSAGAAAWSGGLGRTIAFGNGRFVAADEAGNAGYSFDGTIWTVVPAGLGTANAMTNNSRGVFSSGVFLMPVYTSSTFARGVVGSTDGITWKQVLSSGKTTTLATRANDLLIANGNTNSLFLNY